MGKKWTNQKARKGSSPTLIWNLKASWFPPPSRQAHVPRSAGCISSLAGFQPSKPPPWALHWHPEQQIFAASNARHRSSAVLEAAWAAQPEAEPPEAEPPAPQELSCAGRESAHTSLDSPEPLGLASAHGLQESAPRTLAVPSASDYQAAKRIRISSEADSIKQKWLQHSQVSHTATWLPKTVTGNQLFPTMLLRQTLHRANPLMT